MKTLKNGLLSSVALAMVLNAGTPIVASYAQETNAANEACKEANLDDCPTDPSAVTEGAAEAEKSVETEAGADAEVTAESETSAEELPAEETAETEAEAGADAEVTAESDTSTEELPPEETAETEAEAGADAEVTAESDTSTEELPPEETAETEAEAGADAEVTAESDTSTEELPAEETAETEAEAGADAEVTAESDTSTEELPGEATAESDTDAAADAEVTAEGETDVEKTGETTAANENVDEDTLKATTTPEKVEEAQRESGQKAVQDAERREARKSRREREEDRDERLKILGAVAAGAAIGAIIPQLGGRIVEQQGDRVIVQRGDTFIVLKDENQRLRHGGADVEVVDLDNGWTRTVISRPNGVRVVTIRDEVGYIVERIRVLPNGDEIVLIDNTDFTDQPVAELELNLPPLRIDIPREEYIVEYDEADEDAIIAALTAPPVEQVERAYSLREVRESERLRDKVRSVELDTINFATDSAEVSLNQANTLKRLGQAMTQIIDNDPDEVFMIEGHTDAVGGDLYNLALSDRRAESVATLLTDLFDVPAENMVTQGYGEQNLKVATLGPSRENRRVTVRRITPLLQTSQATSQR